MLTVFGAEVIAARGQFQLHTSIGCVCCGRCCSVLSVC